jgi:hypothetical protein
MLFPRYDVTVFSRGNKRVLRLDSWRARRYFKKHFAGEVVDNRIVFEPSREQELWERIYAISDEEGHSGMVFGTAKDEV